MKKIKIYHLKYLLGVNFFYTLYVNFFLFGIKGVLKLPIIIKYGSRVQFYEAGAIEFKQLLTFNMLTVNSGNKIYIQKGGKLICTGRRSCFNIKNSVLIYKNGIMELGNNFFANGYTEFNCKKGIRFGNDVLISVHVIFLDTDYHPIYNLLKQQINPDKEIYIGNNVWISCNVTILKGCRIADHVVLGAGSVIANHHLSSSNSIYSGNPIKLIKSGIVWER